MAFFPSDQVRWKYKKKKKPKPPLLHEGGCIFAGFSSFLSILFPSFPSPLTGSFPVSFNSSNHCLPPSRAFLNCYKKRKQTAVQTFLYPYASSFPPRKRIFSGPSSSRYCNNVHGTDEKQKPFIFFFWATQVYRLVSLIEIWPGTEVLPHRPISDDLFFISHRLDLKPGPECATNPKKSKCKANKKKEGGRNVYY